MGSYNRIKCNVTNGVLEEYMVQNDMENVYNALLILKKKVTKLTYIQYVPFFVKQQQNSIYVYRRETEWIYSISQFQLWLSLWEIIGDSYFFKRGVSKTLEIQKMYHT